MTESGAAGGDLPKILMVATSYPTDQADWQGRFIFDMAESLARITEFDLHLWAPPGTLPLGVTSALADDDAVWLSQLLQRGGIAHLVRRQPLSGGFYAFNLLRRLRRLYRHFSGDCGQIVAHVNWIQNALPLAVTRIPALITVLGSDLALLKLPGMVQLVRTMLAGRRAILAPNAEWMVASLQESFGDLAEIHPIPFGVNDRWFALHRNPDACSCNDWIIVSRVTKAKLGHLLEWGEGRFGGTRRLHLLGPIQESLSLPRWLEYHGPTNPDTLACDWFPRAAGLITLSTHDEGRPQVMMEAMAAGLPVIASDLPAHRDLLRNGETGFLVDNANCFASALAQLDDPQLNSRIGLAARNWVAEHIGTWDDCARRYVGAYNDLLI